MDAKQCMIVDLERRGDKQMFITDQVDFIKKADNGNWMIRFLKSLVYFSIIKHVYFILHMESLLIYMKKDFILVIST